MAARYRGWVRTAVLMLAGLAAAGPGSAQTPEPKGDRLQVATFGTSLTANGGWQAPLAAAIEACTKHPADVSNFARAGAASDWGVEAVATAAASRPDILLVEFAVNDAALDSFIGLGTSVENMRTIVAAFREQRADVVVYVMSMNPLSGRRSWMRPRRDAFEDAHRQLASELGLGYIDHRPDWNAMGTEALHLAIADGAHPTPTSATAIVVPNVVDRLRNDGVIACPDGA